MRGPGFSAVKRGAGGRKGSESARKANGFWQRVQRVRISTRRPCEDGERLQHLSGHRERKKPRFAKRPDVASGNIRQANLGDCTPLPGNIGEDVSAVWYRRCLSRSQPSALRTGSPGTSRAHLPHRRIGLAEAFLIAADSGRFDSAQPAWSTAKNSPATGWGTMQSW
jgi:hypothetical protein